MKKALLLVLVNVLIIEVFLRVAMKVTKEYNFWLPRYSMYNFELQEIKEYKEADFNILILGGSAISNVLPAKVGTVLEDTLKAQFKGKNIRVTNLAYPGRTSRDMDVVTDFLTPEQQKSFDAIIYYESINDSRFNCIPAEAFRLDYSHSHWYQEVNLMKKHKEMNFTIIPFVIELFKERLEEKSGKRIMLNDDMDIAKDLMPYGSELKTDKSFRKNVNGILTKFKGNKNIYLLQYHTYYPEPLFDHKNLEFHKERTFFKATGPATTTGAWGFPENVVMTVNAHNAILENLSTSSKNTSYVKTDSLLGPLHDEYFDNCHFTDKAGKVFAQYIAENITEGLRKH